MQLNDSRAYSEPALDASDASTPSMRLDRAWTFTAGGALMEAVAQASRCLVEHVDLEHGLSLALDTLRERMQVGRVFINRYAPSELASHFWMESRDTTLQPFDQAFGSGPWPDDAFAELAYPLREGRVYRSSPAHSTGWMSSHAGFLSGFSGLIVPVMHHGICRCCMGFETTDARRWSDADVSVLQGLAAIVAAALARHESEAVRLRAEHARALQAEADSRVLREREGLLQTLTEATRSLLAGDDFDMAVQTTMAMLGKALGVTRVGLQQDLPAADNGQPGQWRTTHEWTAPGHSPRIGTLSGCGTYPCIDAWRTSRTGDVCIADVPPSEAHEGNTQSTVDGSTVLTVPLFLEDRWWGLLGFDQGPGHRWQAHEVAALQTAGACISAAMERRNAETRRLLQAKQQADEARALSHLLRGVVSASRALQDASDLDRGLSAWLEYLARAVDADAAIFGSFADPDAGAHVTANTVYWFKSGDRPRGIEVPRTTDFLSWAEALHRGDLVWAHRDELVDPVSVRFWEERQCQTSLLLPVVASGKTIAWLCFDWCERRAWQPAYADVLRTAADGVAATLQRDLALKQLLAERERAAQIQSAALARANLALQRSTAKLAGTRDLSTFLHHVLAETVKLFPGALAQIFVYNRADDTLAPFIGVDHTGSVRPGPGIVVGTPMAQPFPARVTGAWQLLLDAGGPVEFDLIDDVHLMWPGAAEFHQRMGHRGSVCTVLLAGDEPVGVLGLAEPSNAPFDRADFELMQTFAQQAALAIQTERYAVEAQQAAVAREREQAADARFNELARANESLRTSLAALSRAEDETAFLGHAVLEIARHAGADGVYLFVKAPDEARLPLRLAVRAGESLISDTVLPDDPTLFKSGLLLESARMQRLAKEGGLVWFEIAQGARDDRISPEVMEWHQRRGHGAAALQALMVGDRVVGMLAMTFLSAQPMQPSQLQFVQALCQPLALALELSRLSRKLRRSGEHEAVLIERQRLAREIHDGIAQSFLGIQMQLETQGTPLPAALEPAVALARHGLIEARRAVAALRPHALLNRSLPAAMDRLLEQVTEGSKLNPVMVRPSVWRPLPLETEDHLFRIVQEALNNAIKHSGARVLQVELSQASGEVSILISDDGVGFDGTSAGKTAHGGYGLEGMQQRARLIGASVEVLSKRGEGTQVLVSMSLPEAWMSDDPA